MKSQVAFKAEFRKILFKSQFGLKAKFRKMFGENFNEIQGGRQLEILRLNCEGEPKGEKQKINRKIPEVYVLTGADLE